MLSRVLGLVLWVAVGGVSLAAELTGFAELSFHNYYPDDGLPHEVVAAIAEDGDGFLWIGTADGLARWDGYRFRVYRPHAGDASALPDNNIYSLHQDAAGRLWIGTGAGGLSRYDRDCDCFRNYSTGHARIVNIADDGHGGLLLATDRGVDHLDGDSGVISQSFIADATNRDMHALLVDRSGRLWLGSGDGLELREPGQDKTRKIPLGDRSGGDDSVTVLFEDKAGAVWIGTKHHGAFVMRPGAARPVQIDARGRDLPPMNSLWVYAISEAANGEIWLGSQGQGIVVLTGNGEGRNVRHEPTRHSSLASNRIWSMFRGRSGMMWIGSSVGLSRLESDGDAAYSIYGGSDPGTRHISDEDVTSVFAGPDGLVWLGLAENGIDILDPVTRSITHLHPSDPAQGGAPTHWVGAIARTDKGTMFIGTDNGLFSLDGPKSPAVRREVNPAQPDMRVTALLPDGQHLWVGSGDKGLWRLDLVNGQVDRHFSPELLSNGLIQALALDRHGDLWIGTGVGLNRLDHLSGDIEMIAATPSEQDGLSNGSIASLLIDHGGRLWVGTQGGGINLLPDPSGPRRFVRFGVQDGLPNANVDMLLEQQDGRIWASTDGGFAAIDPATRQIRTLSRADGIAFRGYWGNSGAVTRSGEMLFGGSGGVTVLRPDRVRPWDYQPPLAVTELRIGGHALPWPSDGDRPLAIRPDGNSLSVEFTALDFSASEQNRYRYRLDGYDRDWIDADSAHRHANYTNLPPGQYQLRLRGSNRNGVWSERELTLPVLVYPAWYQTWWFKMLLAIALLVAVAGLLQLRTRHLRQRQRELEAEIARRIDQLADSMRRADSLLANILPRHVIDELSSAGKVVPRWHESASILFTDLAGFTQMAASMPAERMVAELNDIFAGFDEIAHEEGIEKIKTIGDAYMAVAGLSEQHSDHAHRCVRAALRMHQFMSRRNQDSSFKWQVRIGIHSGAVVSGVVGQRKYAFDIWGDSVNVASRMESAGEPGQINISAYTFDLVRDSFDCRYRGKIPAKGKGDIDMYFVDCVAPI